jgi:NTP pyrophosphatase (non-canonical NTP hydrolase)
MSLRDLQTEVDEWATRNFGAHETRGTHQPLLGAVEELGELSHAHLKWEQGIRGTPEELAAKAKDAVADVIIFLTDYCNLRGFDLQDIVSDTWDQVLERDWKKNPQTGKRDRRVKEIVTVSKPGVALEVKEFILTEEDAPIDQPSDSQT